jgi:hypothetical protein
MAEKQHAQMEMSMTLESAINLLRSRDDCVVLPPSGVPVVGPRLKLPPGKRGQGETGSVCNCLTELAQLRGTRKKMPQKKDATEKRCHRKKMPQKKDATEKRCQAFNCYYRCIFDHFLPP